MEAIVKPLKLFDECHAPHTVVEEAPQGQVVRPNSRRRLPSQGAPQGLTRAHTAALTVLQEPHASGREYSVWTLSLEAPHAATAHRMQGGKNFGRSSETT